MAENRYHGRAREAGRARRRARGAQRTRSARSWRRSWSAKEQALHAEASLETALTERRPDDARTLIAELPQATRCIYEQKLADLEALLAKEAQQAARQARRQAGGERSGERRSSAARQFVAEAFQEVERKFNGGDFQRAALEVRPRDGQVPRRGGHPGPARNLKKLIPQFRSRLRGRPEEVRGQLAGGVREAAAQGRWSVYQADWLRGLAG